MQHCLQNMTNLRGVQAAVAYEWPAKELRDAAASIVFIGDQFPPNRFPNAKRNLAEVAEMTKRGCGIVCVHYATGLTAGDVAEDGEHPLLHWGGWVWNIWGYDCVVFRLNRGTLRLGTDDPENLVRFVRNRIARTSSLPTPAWPIR